MDALDLTVEDRVRIDCLAGSQRSHSANCHFASRLASRKLAEALVPGQRLQLAQLTEIGDPAVADRIGYQFESAGLASSSQRRGVTPLVLLLNRSGNISARSLTVVLRSKSE